jgi:1,4-alpha-glucan branching enzyme
MKKSKLLEQGRLGQTGAISAGKTSPSVSTIKLPRPRRTKIKQPMALLQEHCPNGELLSVSFEYFNPNASEVFLAGSFNDWQLRATGLTKQHDGKWSAEVLLKPGQYEYRFVVDGQWQDNPMATRFRANPFGTLNAVIEVKSLES